MPSIKSLLVMIKVQPADKAIRCPRYLIGATREGSNALSLDPAAPLPLRDLIFLNIDDNLWAWLLANYGKHLRDQKVLE